jgi:hypothetical protein
MMAAQFVICELAKKPFAPKRVESISQTFRAKLRSKLLKREREVFGNKNPDGDDGMPVSGTLDPLTNHHHHRRRRHPPPPPPSPPATTTAVAPTTTTAAAAITTTTTTTTTTTHHHRRRHHHHHHHHHHHRHHHLLLHPELAAS